MLETRNNLMVFLFANNGVNFDSGAPICTSHTLRGKKYIESFVAKKNRVAGAVLIQARYFKTRKDKFEYIKEKYPIIAEFEAEIGLSV